MLTALIVLHGQLAGLARPLAAGPGGGPVIPNPAPAQIPGLSGPVNTVISWAKYAVLILGVIGLIICAGKMVIGHRNRATFAADGATGIPWVIGGLSLVLAAAGIVTVFL